MAISINTRLQRIEAALNDVRREASWISTLNGARNPLESFQHTEELERRAQVIVHEAFEIAQRYAGILNAIERRKSAAEKGGK
jgi:hypothetical protein